uniref:uS12 prolyl 3-hydroxylase n=1 Tax=Romanomermis culicivorax TaxID=13658 RepID=A0A915HYT2_ROMCU
MSTSNGKLLLKPFRCSALGDFIQCEKPNIVDAICEECSNLKLNRKNNDLYSFSQSNDLSQIKNVGPLLAKVRRFLQGDVRKWLSQLTDSTLSDHVSMTVSCYNYTDILLCHDDKLENRRFAYVIYLSPDWREECGGKLEIFTTDDSNNPIQTVESISPLQNIFMFFEVLPNSFHQVAEVTEPGYSRMSINGWFHGAPTRRPSVTINATYRLISPGFVEVGMCNGIVFYYKDIITWINPQYVDGASHPKIRETFENDSEIALRNFLQKDKYDTVMQELSNPHLEWAPKLPLNKRKYSSLAAGINSVKMPALNKCLEIMKSSAFFLLLSQLTGLSLYPFNLEDSKKESPTKNGHIYLIMLMVHDPTNFIVLGRQSADDSDQAGPSKIQKLEEESDDKLKDECLAKCKLEIRRFNRGCYTLLHDDGTDSSIDERKFALDAQLFFTSSQWKVNRGGYTCYVAKDEDEELLTIVPRRNTLALVYREDDTMKFVKYLNNRVGSAEFIDIAGVYYDK